ncbi:MAG TPA: GTPase ObgE [Vicinamibacterales bacterium]|nr:GTPase ObgE [Vicinamibacterales bacterium]
MFVDEVDIQVIAGNGGNGCMSFRREMRVPRGGPNGGDGGNGGSIYLVASAHQNTLVHYRFHPEFKAERGQHGMGSDCTGYRGADMELEVPPGTVVYDKHGEELIALADLRAVGDRVLVARGGDGGRGNAAFRTATNRAPRRTEPGFPGEQRTLRLRLKLLADVGLVGYPNAGKSTLISRISEARPKIADYPFTTLSPNLGVVSLSEDRSFVVADVPGLIEGAHLGHGLGTKFLAHLERTKVLVHVIDVSSASGRDPVHDFDVISRELELFAGGGDDTAVVLASKPRIAAANKIDAMDDPDRLKRLAKHLKKLRVPLFPVSAVTGEGMPVLLEAMWKAVAAEALPTPA